MNTEVEQIQDALISKYSIDTIRHATFLVISRTATVTDPLHNSGEAVAVGSGCKVSFYSQ